MKTLAIFRNNTVRNNIDEIELNEKLQDNQIVPVYTYEDMIFIESEKSQNYLKSNSNIELGLFVTNRDKIYKFLNYIGAENIHQCTVILPSGSIVDVCESNLYELNNILITSSYPVDEVKIRFNGKKSTMNFRNRTIKFEKGFPIKRALKKLAEIC